MSSDYWGGWERASRDGAGCAPPVWPDSETPWETLRVSAPLTGQLCEVCAPGKSWETSMATDRGRVCAADKESGCAGGARAALGNRYGHGKPAADARIRD